MLSSAYKRTSAKREENFNVRPQPSSVSSDRLNFTTWSRFQFSAYCIRFLMSSLESEAIAFNCNAVLQQGVYHINPRPSAAGKHILYYRMCGVSHTIYPQKWKRWKFAFENSCGVTEKYSSEGSKIVTLSNILMLVILRLWAHVSGRGSIALSSKCVALPCDAAVWKDQDGRLHISQRKHASFLPPPVVEVVWSGRSGEWKWESAAEQICNACCQIGKNWKSTRRNNLSLSPTSVSSSSPELNVSCTI